MMKVTPENVTSQHNYQEFEASVAEAIAKLPAPRFKMRAEAIWDYFLSNLPEDGRQVYNCKCCRKFIEDYGTVVHINEAGDVQTIWHHTGDFFRIAVTAMNNYLATNCQVEGVFYSKNEIWGTPEKGGWTHLHGNNAIIWDGLIDEIIAKTAEKKQDFIMIMQAIYDYNVDIVEKTLTVIEADILANKEQYRERVQWFLDIKKINNVDGKSFVDKQFRKIIWNRVATAPAGWCHINSSMIGTLLEDLKAGLNIEAVKARWNEKMHPLQYRRPTKEVTENMIKEAEKTVEKLGIARSLERRYARQEDIKEWLWLRHPESIPVASGGVFDKLRSVSAQQLELPTRTMTWNKFENEILPGVIKIEYYAALTDNFYGLVTAFHDDAPLIQQWPNAISWYLYVGESSSSNWGLNPGSFEEVNGIFRHPGHWLGNTLSRKELRFLNLKKAKDINHKMGGGLFIDNLKSELNPVRAVIEKHTKMSGISGKEAGDANGVIIFRGNHVGLKLKVTTTKAVAVYDIDRWE